MILNVKRYFDEESTKQKILVGNKIDLVENRKIIYSQGKELADKLGFDFIEVSAKDNTNISELFENITFLNK